MQLKNQTQSSVSLTPTDRELFLQAFEKPTQIYRYLKARSSYAPSLFLNRNLTFLKSHSLSQRRLGCSKNVKPTHSFKVDSLLEAITPSSVSKLTSSNFSHVLNGSPTANKEDGQRHLTFTFIGFFDKHWTQHKFSSQTPKTIFCEIFMMTKLSNNSHDSPRNDETIKSEEDIEDSPPSLTAVHSPFQIPINPVVQKSNNKLLISSSSSTTISLSSSHFTTRQKNSFLCLRLSTHPPTNVKCQNKIINSSSVLSSTNKKRNLSQSSSTNGTNSSNNASIPERKKARRLLRTATNSLVNHSNGVISNGFSDRGYGGCHDSSSSCLSGVSASYTSCDLCVFNDEGCVELLDGEYEILLNEQQHNRVVSDRYAFDSNQVGSNLSPPHSSWQSFNMKYINDKSLEDQIEVFENSPTLKFHLTWSDEKTTTKTSSKQKNSSNKNSLWVCSRLDGCQPKTSISPLNSNSLVVSSNHHNFSLVYHFMYPKRVGGGNGPNSSSFSGYDLMTAQKTDSENDLRCPWCLLNCFDIYPLLKHLNYSHPRFIFTYHNENSLHKIDVRVNDQFDLTFSSHSSHPYFQYGPVRRNPSSQIIVMNKSRRCRKLFHSREVHKALSNNMTEFVDPSGYNKNGFESSVLDGFKPSSDITNDFNGIIPHSVALNHALSSSTSHLSIFRSAQHSYPAIHNRVYNYCTTNIAIPPSAIISSSSPLLHSTTSLPPSIVPSLHATNPAVASFPAVSPSDIYLQGQPRQHEVEDRSDPPWLIRKMSNMIDEFTDVNCGEKQFMKLWNTFIQKFSFRYVGDCHIERALSDFISLHAGEVSNKRLYKNLILHLTNLYDFGTISPAVFHATISRYLFQTNHKQSVHVIPNNNMFSSSGDHSTSPYAACSSGISTNQNRSIHKKLVRKLMTKNEKKTNFSVKKN